MWEQRGPLPTERWLSGLSTCLARATDGPWAPPAPARHRARVSRPTLYREVLGIPSASAKQRVERRQGMGTVTPPGPQIPTNPVWPFPHLFSAAGYGSGRGSAPGHGHAGGPGRRRGGRGRAEPPVPRSCLWGQEGSRGVLGWAPQELAETWAPRSRCLPSFAPLPFWALLTASSLISWSSHLWMGPSLSPPARFMASRTLGFAASSRLTDPSKRWSSWGTSSCGATGRRGEVTRIPCPVRGPSWLSVGG